MNLLLGVLGWIVLMAVPPLVFAAFGRLLDWWARGGRTPRAPGPRPVGPPIERLVDDLRRLERDRVRVEGSDLPRREVRLRGIGLAYDDALCACGRAVGVAVEGRPPLDPVARLRLETDLARAGLVW